MSEKHSLLSPSGAHRWMRCAASLSMQQGCKRTSSEFADEGTAAHTLAAQSLSMKVPTSFFIGDTIPAGGRSFVVDQAMADNVRRYVDAIHARIDSFKLLGAVSVELFVENRVDFSSYVGFDEQTGTADAILAVFWPDGSVQIDVNDLKYGMGVCVDAPHNEQMQLYALGALNDFAFLGEFKTASMAIHQPRINHFSGWECSVEDLLIFAEEAKKTAQKAMFYLDNPAATLGEDAFTPGDDQCRFCSHKANCEALKGYVAEAVFGDFQALTPDAVAPEKTTMPKDNNALALALSKVALVQSWCKAVSAAAYEELTRGNPVPGYKIVRGKQGNRAWVDEKVAETTLKEMRLKKTDMYSFALLSPTAMEKVLGKTAPKKWDLLQSHIVRKPGTATVAPDSDPRQAMMFGEVSDDFSNEDVLTK